MNGEQFKILTPSQFLVVTSQFFSNLLDVPYAPLARHVYTVGTNIPGCRVPGLENIESFPQTKELFDLWEL